MASSTLGDRGQNDSLVEIRTWIRCGQCCQEADNPCDAAQLRGTRHARANVVGEPTAISVTQLPEQIGVEEWACSLAVEGSTVVKSAHTLFMTGRAKKVASRLQRGRFSASRRAPTRWRTRSHRTPIPR